MSSFVSYLGYKKGIPNVVDLVDVRLNVEQ